MAKVTEKLEVGQKVILANGITGRIIGVDELRQQVEIAYDKVYADAYGYDGKLHRRMRYDEDHLQPFYLLGRNLIGNKDDAAELIRDMEFYKNEIALLNQQLATLRRQLFMMNERMVPDWRERQQNAKSHLSPEICPTRDESNSSDK